MPPIGQEGLRKVNSQCRFLKVLWPYFAQQCKMETLGPTFGSDLRCGLESHQVSTAGPKFIRYLMDLSTCHQSCTGTVTKPPISIPISWLSRWKQVRLSLYFCWGTNTVELVLGGERPAHTHTCFPQPGVTQSSGNP